MPRFFIDRPIFAWVVALFIILLGLIAIPQLPIARYPTVAPPTVSIYATYPGATPQTMNDAVVGLIERDLSSVKNLLYFESSTDTSGAAEIRATFKPGTNPEMAQVDVQNRIKTVEPRLPAAVRQNGLRLESAASSFLMIVSAQSTDGQYDEVALSDHLARNVVEELRRIEGVGRVQLFGAERAMRIWVDPARLLSYKLSMGDLSDAVARQNVQIAPGQVGGAPTVEGQRVTVPVTVQGQLQTPAEFAAIVLKAHPDGSKVVLGDVARVALGAQSYAEIIRENGKPASALAVQLAPGANAVRTAAAVHTRLAELSRSTPPGVSYSVPFDTAPFVKISIEKVVQTLLEAMVLVFLVMYLFLQNIRYTLIPAIVAPIALLGTFAVMLAAGFSINVLTMFGMVLAIGIVVDDAIVVVENVERIMATQGLAPREATIKAMQEISGAVVGITLVLIAVFIPMAFSGGSVGVIYRQFTLSMAVAILFSAFLALSLTPALCATLLHPHSAHAARGFFGWFNRGFRPDDRPATPTACWGWCDAAAGSCSVCGPGGRSDAGARAVALGLPARGGPGVFHDLHPVALRRHHRTHPECGQSLRGPRRQPPGHRLATGRAGLQLLRIGAQRGHHLFQHATLERAQGATSAAEEVAQAQLAMGQTPEGMVMNLMPPAIEELGTSSGFALRLQDRANQGFDALMKAQARLLRPGRRKPAAGAGVSRRAATGQ
jgi:multidrug efflux pump